MRCDTCRFFESHAKYNLVGECRRNAPVPPTRRVPPPIAMWPQVQTDQWCGQYEEVRRGDEP